MRENFVPIQMRTLQSGLPFRFDLYVKVNQKYLLYLRSGDSLETKRLSKLKEFKDERFFINKEDLPTFKNFVGELLEETLDVQFSNHETSTSEAPSPKKTLSEEEGDGHYFNFSDIDRAKKKKQESRPSNTPVKLSAQIKSMVEGHSVTSRQQEGPEQKLQRQVEVVNSIAQTAIDVINRILKDPDSLVAYQVIQKSAKGLRVALTKGPAIFAKLYHMDASKETPLINHSKNVAVLAVQLGVLHKLKEEELENLAIAAMIHDIGLTQIPATQNPIQLFLTPKEKLSEEESAIYWDHVKWSVQVMEEKNFIPQKIIDLVESHEETLSGSGPLKKNQLELDQQILSLTNRYEEFMRERELDPKKGIQEFSIQEIGNYELKLIESLKKMATTLTQKKS